MTLFRLVTTHQLFGEPYCHHFSSEGVHPFCTIAQYAITYAYEYKRTYTTYTHTHTNTHTYIATLHRHCHVLIDFCRKIQFISLSLLRVSYVIFHSNMVEVSRCEISVRETWPYFRRFQWRMNKSRKRKAHLASSYPL